MADDKNRNLLFAVLAVQLKGVSPERAMEAAAAWLVNPATPLSGYLEELGILPAADIKLLGTLVDEIVKSFEGNAEEALKSLPGGTELSLTLVGRHAPGPHQDTRPMVDLPEGMHVLSAAALEELPGRYSQVSEYGRGGMGRVLLVHDELFGREIALKELLIPHDPDHEGPEPSPMGEASGMLGRFLQEARITGQLEHPAIVPVYEIGRRLNGTFYYTMKLMRGKTLARAIRDCKSLEERLRILPSILDLCQALAYAHSRRVIHRDIKPANAMIGEFGETVLLDWGLAKIQGTKDVYSDKLRETLRSLKLKEPEKTPRTQAGEAIGTPHYMPPEQARGEIDKLDERSDVYSMGAMLYETLTGKPPFDGETARSIINQVLNDEPRSIEALAPGTPPELIAICRKAMAKRPEARYQTMLELRDDLVRFQTGAFVQSYRYNPREAITLYYRQHRVRLNAAAAAIAVVIAVGIWSYISIWQARELEKKQREAAETAKGEAEVARGEAEVARGEAETSRDLALRQQYLAQIRLAQSHIEDQQMRLANEALERAPEAERDWVWKYLHNEANASLFRVRSEKSVIFQALYDPTGKYIVALRTPETPGLWNAEDGTFIRDFEGKTERYNFASFNQNGRRFAAIGDGGVLDIWDVETGARLQHLSYTSEGIALAFDPSAHRIWAGYAGGPLVEWDIETGQALRSLDTGGRTVGALFPTPVSNVLISLCSAAPTAGAPTLSNAVVAWDTASGKIRYEIEGTSLWPSPDGKMFIRSANISHTEATLKSPNDTPQHEFRSRLTLHDAETGVQIADFEGHRSSVLHVSFASDGQQFVSSSVDGTARLWSIDQTVPAAEVFSPTPLVRVFLSGTQHQMLGCSSDNRVIDWNLINGKPTAEYAGENTFLSDAVLSPDRERILTSSALHTFETFPTRFSEKALSLIDNSIRHPDVNETVSEVVLSIDEKLAAVVSGVSTRTIRVANLQTMAWVAEFETDDRAVPRAALTSDGTQIVYCKNETEIALGNMDTGAVTTLTVLDEPISALAASPSGSSVASATTGNLLQVWDLVSGEETSAFRTEGVVSAIAIPTNGNEVLAGFDDGFLRLYDIASGTLKTSMVVHAGRVLDVALQGDSGSAASVGFDGSVVLSDLMSTRSLQSYGVSESYSQVMDSRFSVRFTMDGRYLFVHHHMHRTLVVDTRDREVLLGPETGVFIESVLDGSALIKFTEWGSITLSAT